MRKPAVVVTAAVSAVLAGGIMVATTAGAEETPDAVTAPSVQWPDLPAIPQLPGGADLPAVPAVPGDPGPAAGHAAPAHQARPDDQAGTADQAEPADDQAQPNDQRPAVIRPARPAAAATTPATADAGEDKRNKATQPDKPKTLVAQPGNAKRDVTASQALSTDPRSSVQQQALELVNENRRRGGCENLSVDRRLIVAANKHAADMARRGYFAHEDSQGDRAGERVEDAGYRWKRFGENIARGQDSVYEVVNGWMNSPEHRENIMDCDLHQVGVGLAFSGDRTPYWVQDFATPQ
jgi:uncharacterized protein YkwD